MRLIAAIIALFGLAAYPACQTYAERLEQAKIDARTRVVECFLRRHVVANDSHLADVPVRFVPYAEATCSGSPACFLGRKEIIIGTYGPGETYRADFEIAKSLRHEYVHALLDISGLPDVEHPNPLMEDCEQ